MYIVSSVEELQNLNPFIVIGCGGGGEKFSNFEGVEAVGFVDDNPSKHGKLFCGFSVSSDLIGLLNETEAKSVAIMLPIGAEGSALKYAVQAINEGKNVVTSFRSLSVAENTALLKFAEQKNVLIKEISPRLDTIDNLFGVAPSKCCEMLPKINYQHKTPVVYVGGTSQECGKRTTTRLLGKAAMDAGMEVGVISTDEMGLEQPVDLNFRAGSLSVMDIASSIIGSIKYLEDEKNPDIIFVESQSSLTELGNPHPRGLSASILIGSSPEVSVLCHRPNHPYRQPRGVLDEIRAIESVEPTKVVGISLNLRNVDAKGQIEKYESEYGLPAVDVKNGGSSQLLNVIIDFLGEIK
ncbi:MAG: DUF1611 domain-containing protein [Methanobacteriaceae archaeon]|nr:DUF1611 domain-containing protein [Methanobacteriaceae archaeon]MDO9627631.1 DUF1611 domain-containing protein [Methanobacteriaceae archaeon]